MVVLKRCRQIEEITNEYQLGGAENSLTNKYTVNEHLNIGAEKCW